ncbi:hypothetical protein LCGC14_0251310 [marine sediment metagenome]|uniref:Uncharacterized protein n=1 Tax=marine sediment metagenome TaxID=412755 RepID=A0A0F9U8X6_9ZZZZ
MPGRITKDLVKARGAPPEKGGAAWRKLVARIVRHVHQNQPICGEAGGRRRDGWPCESRWTMANGLCKMHGGAARRGAEHPAFVHGRASRVYDGLPARFKQAYLASIQDDDLLSLRSELAMADVRAGELVERLDTGESGERWRRLGQLAEGLVSELGTDDPSPDALRGKAAEISALSERAADDERAWRELRSSHQHRRKLADTERKRLKDLHAYLTAEEALAIIARLTDTIVRHVEDKAALTAILHEIQALTGNDPGDQRRLALLS